MHPHHAPLPDNDAAHERQHQQQEDDGFHRPGAYRVWPVGEPPLGHGRRSGASLPARGLDAFGLPAAPPVVDLEGKDARLIFTPIWEALEQEVGREHLRFPKEIILLGGAPGAGKGTQTQFINQVRGLTCPPIVMSELLTTPEMARIKAQGGMVGDAEVVAVLLRTFLEPTYRDGVVLDGFPRTPVQVECLKLFVDRLRKLYDEFAHTHLAIHFRRPTIRVIVLFVSEATSVARQPVAGGRSPSTIARVAEAGIGTPIELRPTDLSEDLVRRRYQVFKEQTWAALTSLRQLYHYHFINVYRIEILFEASKIRRG